MYADMTAAELIEREDEYIVDPWGPERADLSIGLLCSLTDACHRAKGDPLGPLDYMPYVRATQERDEPKQSAEEMKAIFDAVATRWNKRNG